MLFIGLSSDKYLARDIKIYLSLRDDVPTSAARTIIGRGNRRDGHGLSLIIMSVRDNRKNVTKRPPAAIEVC